jgi:hypothetical protein
MSTSTQPSQDDLTVTAPNLPKGKIRKRSDTNGYFAQILDGTYPSGKPHWTRKTVPTRAEAITKLTELYADAGYTWPPAQEPPDRDEPEPPEEIIDGGGGQILHPDPVRKLLAIDPRSPARSAAWWEQRPVLAHIRRYALARGASPAAMLGVAIERMLAVIPPTVVLPPTIRGDGSLNLFCGIVGRAGAGKGSAEDAARDGLIFPGEPIVTAPLGSGEGIAHCYAHREMEQDEAGGKKVSVIRYDTHSVLFTSPEVGTITAIGDRRGSTLLEQLRSAFSGEQLGFSYADKDRKIILTPHSYRFCLTVGVQPENAAGLMDDAAGGTPQRFIWMPGEEPSIPDHRVTAPDPWKIPAVRWGDLPANDRGRHEIPIPDEVADYVWSAHVARQRGSRGVTADMDGHLIICREKVAVALAALDGRGEMTIEDWELSGDIIALSNATRQRVVNQLNDQKRKQRENKALAEAETKYKAETYLRDVRLERIATRIARYLGKTEKGEMFSNPLQKKFSSDEKKFVDEALELLEDRGSVSIITNGTGRLVRLRTPSR